MKKNGSTQYINPSNDLNNFYNGTGLFSSSTKNLPVTDWCLVTSAGASGTTSQVAKVIWSDTTYKRFCAAGEWTGWTEYKPIPNNIVTFGGFTIGGIRMTFDNELDAICLYIQWIDGEGRNRTTKFKCHTDIVG